MLSNWGLWDVFELTYSVSSNDVLWTNIVRVIKCGCLIDLLRNSTLLCHIKASSWKRELHSIWCDFTCFPWTVKKKFTRKRALTSWNIMCLLLSFCFGSSTKLHHALQVLILLNLGGLIQLNLPGWNKPDTRPILVHTANSFVNSAWQVVANKAFTDVCRKTYYFFICRCVQKDTKLLKICWSFLAGFG